MGKSLASLEILGWGGAMKSGGGRADVLRLCCPRMTTRQPRIVDIALDERTILLRSADVEQERRVAIFDLLEANYFDPVPELGGTYGGPWRIIMRIEEGRLAIDLQAEDEASIATLMLALTPVTKG